MGRSIVDEVWKMIISGNNSISGINKAYGVDTVKSGKGVREAGKSSTQRSDEVVLSSEAQGLQQQIAAIKALPDVRQDKVAELSHRIESGQYQVDAAKLADQMIGRALADKLVKKGYSLGIARKTPIICGLLISTCIMGANYTNDPVWIMTLMAVAFFGNGFASITWSLVSSLAPMRLIGLTGGVFNFVGGLGGITVPLVIGYLAQDYGFGPALVYISAVALIGALSYILLVGDVKRVG